MTPSRGLSIVTTLLLLAPLSPAVAQSVEQHQYVMDLGAGILVKPRYPGSSDAIAVPYPLIAFSRFYVPGYGQVDDENSTRRFAVYPSFNYIGKRDASHSSDLQGLDNVDWALEAGLGVSYRYDFLRAFAEVRQGFNGYSGQVANFGVDLIGSPMQDLELRIGPRAGWGSQNYMETYFGITPGEAANSPVFDKSYKVGAGFNTVGLAGSASYDLTDRWKLSVLAGWNRLIGDAGNSPIVQQGSQDQYYAGAGMTYEFAFDLF